MRHKLEVKSFSAHLLFGSLAHKCQELQQQFSSLYKMRYNDVTLKKCQSPHLKCNDIILAIHIEMILSDLMS